MNAPAALLEVDLARMLGGRTAVFSGYGGLDRAKVDGAALALCQLHCNAVRPGKRCERRCAGQSDAGISNSTHMNRMRAFAVAVLNAEPVLAP